MFDTQKLNKFNKILLIIFFALQPVLEILVSLFKDDFLSIAGVPLSTITRYLLFAVIFVLAILANYKKKSTWVLLGYTALCGMYIVLHYFNVKNFDVVINQISTKKTFIQCAFNISEFFMPVCIMLLVVVLGFGYKHFRIAAITGTAVAVLSLILTNLLGLDFISYNYGSLEHPTGNVISWFMDSINVNNWYAYTSRGLFDSGNSIAAFLSLLLPVTIFIALKEKKVLLFALSFLQMLALLMVGTRISVYGAIILFAITIIIFLFDTVFNKKKFDIKKAFLLLMVAVFFVTCFFFSPFISRLESGTAFDTNYTPNENIINNTQEVTVNFSDYNTKESKIVFIRDNYYYHYLSEEFIVDYYDYREHTDFWFDFMTEIEFEKRDNARKIKSLILNDLVENKGGTFDRWLGIGEAAVYPEMDFVAVYYDYGIIGIVLFLAPYLLISLATAIKLLTQLFKKKFDMMSCCLLLALGFVLASAFYAGNTMVYAYINIFIGLVSGMLLRSLLKDKKECNEPKAVTEGEEE